MKRFVVRRRSQVAALSTRWTHHEVVAQHGGNLRVVQLSTVPWVAMNGSQENGTTGMHTGREGICMLWLRCETKEQQEMCG